VSNHLYGKSGWLVRRQWLPILVQVAVARDVLVGLVVSGYKPKHGLVTSSKGAIAEHRLGLHVYMLGDSLGQEILRSD